MEKFIIYISEFAQLNLQQIEFLRSKAKQLELKKGDYFFKEGQISREFGFIAQGIVRVYYYNEKGEEITKYFIEENNITVDIESFTNEIPSSAYVQALTECRIIYFSKADWQALLETINIWDAIAHKLVSKALLLKVERLSPMVNEDAAKRYLKFMEVYPGIINRVPLNYIASYLGITQSTLSRIRKKVY